MSEPAATKPLARYVEEVGIGIAELAAAAGLDLKLVSNIVKGNFTPSPFHRGRIASALGVSPGAISWDHAVPVRHLRGNGPQCGRST